MSDLPRYAVTRLGAMPDAYFLDGARITPISLILEAAEAPQPFPLPRGMSDAIAAVNAISASIASVETMAAGLARIDAVATGTEGLLPPSLVEFDAATKTATAAALARSVRLVERLPGPHLGLLEMHRREALRLES